MIFVSVATIFVSTASAEGIPAGTNLIGYYADEIISVTGCKHNYTEAENHRAVYLPFYQIFTGYNWSVSSIGLSNYSGIVTTLDIVEKDVNDSVQKFMAQDQTLQQIKVGDIITVGDLFKEGSGNSVRIVDSQVEVFVSAVDEYNVVEFKYTANTTDWTQGTIEILSGAGEITISITDYYFCKTTVLTDLTVTESDDGYGDDQPIN